jgi:hypothetical protein
LDSSHEENSEQTLERIFWYEKEYKENKVKLSLCLTLRHEDLWGSGCIDPRFLDLGLVGSGELHTLAALSPGKEPPVPNKKEYVKKN